MRSISWSAAASSPPSLSPPLPFASNRRSCRGQRAASFASRLLCILDEPRRDTHHRVVKTALILVPGLLCDEAVWTHQSEALATLADVQIATNGARESLV